MSVFTFSSVVLPKCESSWGEGFVLGPGPELALPVFLLLCALPNLYSSLTALLGSLPGRSVARRAAPPHVLRCSLSLPFVVICFVSKGVRCRGGLGFMPLCSASELGAGPDLVWSHFCVKVKAPGGECPAVLLTVRGDPVILPGLLHIPRLCWLQPNPFSAALLFPSDGGVSSFSHFENHLHNVFRVLWYNVYDFCVWCACYNLLKHIVK